MAVIEERPITMVEVMNLAGDTDKGKTIKKFLKNYTKMSDSEANKMKQELRDLDLIKLKESHIVKIIDFMPENLSELNKIIGDNSLDQDEIIKILDVVKKY